MEAKDKMRKELLYQELVLPNGQVIKNRFFKSAMHEAMGASQGQLVRLCIYSIVSGRKEDQA